MSHTKISCKRLISDNGTILPNSKRTKPTPVFLQKLFHMLEHSSADFNDASVLSWSHDGKCFTIHSIQSFTKRVLPKYFESSFTSFKRQLNYYGFQKLNDEQIVINDDDQSRSSFDSTSESQSSRKNKQKQTISYRHEQELFQKGRADLLEQIKRTTSGVDPKVEAEETKQKVSLLEHQVSDLQDQIIQMQSQMKVFMNILTTQNSNAGLQPENRCIEVNETTLPPLRSFSTTCLNSMSHCKSSESTSSSNWNLLRDVFLEVTPDKIHLTDEDADALLRASSILSTSSDALGCNGPARIEIDIDDIDTSYEAVFQS